MASTSRRFPRLVAAGAALGLTLIGLHPASASNDSLYAQQWSLPQANVPAAWATTTGSGIKIGIVDSGVNRNHDDLKDRVSEVATCTDTGGNASNCTTGAGAGNDIAGHGSHVSGIAAATMGNGSGIAGVAPTAQIVMARVFKPSSNGEPTADLNDVKAGIDWVVAHGAKVVNLSLGVSCSGVLCATGITGGNNQNSPLGPAVQAAWDAGAIPVIAAGNDGGALFGSNGSYGDLDAIVVGATIKSGAVATYSNGLTSGTKWGIVAPGGDNNGVDADMILSTYAGSGCNPADAPNCYAYLSGTSMAAPMVSGAAALLLSQGLSREDVVATLLSTADKVSCGSGCQGRLNVGNAVAAHAGSNSGGGGGNTSTPTTKKKSTVTRAPGTTALPATTTTGVPDTTAPSTTSTTTRRQAIVLKSTNSGGSKGVPAGAGVAGVLLLGLVAIGTFVTARRGATSAATH